VKKQKPESKSVTKKTNFTNQIPLSIGWDELIASRWNIPLILLFLLVFIFSIRLVSSFDIGFHLASGRWILENFSFPSKDVFTYTVNNNDYIDIQWLFQVINYLVYSLFSYEGLTFLNAFLIVIVFYLLLKRLMLYGVQPSFCLFGLFMTLVAMQVRISNRPEVFTWIGILLILLILDNYYLKGEKNLYFLPLIIMFWINLHGLFVIGLFITAAYFISIWYKQKGLDKYFLKWLGISAVATLINPYFIEGAMFPFYLFSRLQSSNIFKNSISELQSPFEITENLQFEIYLYATIAILSFGLIIFTFKRRSLHEFIILVGFFYLSISAYRNIPIFIIYGGYIITISFFDIYRKKNFEKIFDSKKLVSKYSPYFVSLVFVLIGMRIITNAYYLSYGSGISFGAGLNKNSLPEDVSEFILKNNIKGKLLNQLDAGGWLMWRLKEPVFIDGRLEVMKEDFFSEYNKSFKINGLNQLIGEYKPELLIFNHATAYVWTDQLNKLFEWKPIYFDENFVVYSNRNLDNYISSDIFAKVMLNNNLDTSISGNGINEVLNFKERPGIDNWLRGFYEKQDHNPGLLNLANFALQNNLLKEAEILYLNYFFKTQNEFEINYHKDAYINLGEIYLANINLNSALICFENYLNLDSDDNLIIQKVRDIKSRLNKKN